MFQGHADDSAHEMFDAAKNGVCGKNYQGGYVKGCTSAGGDKASCEEDEDSQKNDD